MSMSGIVVLVIPVTLNSNLNWYVVVVVTMNSSIIGNVAISGPKIFQHIGSQEDCPNWVSTGESPHLWIQTLKGGPGP